VKYGRSKRERWYLYGKSAGLGTGGTNGRVGSGWGAVPSAEVVMGGGGMEPTEGSETSAIINQTPGNYPKENLLYSVHGESLKSRIKNHVGIKEIT